MRHVRTSERHSSRYTRQTCTDVPWNVCFTQHVQPAKVVDIRFYKRDPVRRGKKRHTLPPSISDEQASFISDLASGNVACVCQSTFTAHNECFVTAAPRPTTKLPAPLRTLFRKENRLLSSRQLAVTRSEAAFIEECTSNQASGAAWHEQRSGRITASGASLTHMANKSIFASNLFVRYSLPTLLYS